MIAALLHGPLLPPTPHPAPLPTLPSTLPTLPSALLQASAWALPPPPRPSHFCPQPPLTLGPLPPLLRAVMRMTCFTPSRPLTGTAMATLWPQRCGVGGLGCGFYETATWPTRSCPSSAAAPPPPSHHQCIIRSSSSTWRSHHRHQRVLQSLGMPP